MDITTFGATITSVKYELSTTTLAALGLDDRAACEVYEEALGALFPEAGITLGLRNGTEDSMLAESEEASVTKSGDGLAVLYLGRLDDGEDVMSMEMALEAEMERVWKRALELATARVAA